MKFFSIINRIVLSNKKKLGKYSIVFLKHFQKNSYLADRVYKSLYKRIEERRTVYSTLLNFLKNPNKKSDFGKDLHTTLIKSELKALILRFAKGPEKNILYHSTSIIASRIRIILHPFQAAFWNYFTSNC